MSTPNPTFPVLSTLNYNQVLSNLIGAWAAESGAVPQLLPGDPLLALFQAVSSQIVFLESVAQYVANLTRAQTSTGTDLDSWMAQFDFTRLPAVYAVGPVTLGVNSVHNTSTNVSLNTVVQTVGGAIQYQLIADTTQAAYDPTSQSYVLPANTSSITATAQALAAGSSSNVQAGQLTQFSSPPAGIDTVTNGLAIQNGLDAESDSAFLARFVVYIQNLSKATLGAVEEAITSVQADLNYVVLDNTNAANQFQPGMFTVVIDDGSGNPPSTLINAVANAVAAVRGLSILSSVIGPQLVSGTVSLAVRLASGYTLAMVTASVQDAVATFSTTLTIGGAAYIDAIMDAAKSVTGVLSVAPTMLIDGVNSDLLVTPLEVWRVTAGNVTVTSYT